MKKTAIFIITILIPGMTLGKPLRAQEHLFMEDPTAHQHELELEKQREKQLEEVRIAEQARMAEQRRQEELRVHELAEKEERLEREARARETASHENEPEETENELNECIRETVLRRLSSVNSPEKNAEIQAIIAKLMIAAKALARYELKKFGTVYESMTGQEIDTERTKALHAYPGALSYDPQYSKLISQEQDLRNELQQAQATPELMDDIIDECLTPVKQPIKSPTDELEIIST